MSKDEKKPYICIFRETFRHRGTPTGNRLPTGHIHTYGKRQIEYIRGQETFLRQLRLTSGDFSHCAVCYDTLIKVWVETESCAHP